MLRRFLIAGCLLVIIVPFVFAMGKAPKTLKVKEEGRQTKMRSKSLTLPVIADTWVYAFQPERNYGSGGGWRDITDPTQAKTEPKMFLGFAGADIEMVLLKFDLGALEKEPPVSSARVLVYNDYAGSDAPITVAAHQITSDWEENKVTFRNRPKIGPALSTTKLQGHISEGQAGKWYSWDVTAAVKAWQKGEPNYGIMLVPQGESGVDFDLVARENEAKSQFAPKLEIEY